jgi:hypothetical protein
VFFVVLCDVEAGDGPEGLGLKKGMVRGEERGGEDDYDDDYGYEYYYDSNHDLITITTTMTIKDKHY